MIIWQGLGFLVLLLAFAAMAGTRLVVNAIFHDDAYYGAHPWAMVVGGAIAGALIFAFSNWLGRRPAQTVIDKATGEELELRTKHTLFYIPVKYWPYIVVSLTLVFAFGDRPTA